MPMKMTILVTNTLSFLPDFERWVIILIFWHDFVFRKSQFKV